MTTAKKTAPAPAEDAPDSPPDTTEVTFDGVRAVDTQYDEDGNATGSVPRLATFAESIAALAPQVLTQAVGIVPLASGGTVETDGNVITLTLRSH